MRGRWRLLTGVLVLLALTCGALAWKAQTDGRSPQPRTALSAPSAPTTQSGSPGPPVVIRPKKLRIASIEVSTELVSLGLNDDKTVELPPDPAVAGWYRLGPAPGSAGSAVILGHVDSAHGAAVFYRLRTLRHGARLDVDRVDGSTIRFAVRSVKIYANRDFPAAEVYRNRGAPTLTLVTCGGAYDKAHGGYQSNVVVAATYLGRVG